LRNQICVSRFMISGMYVQIKEMCVRIKDLRDTH